MKRTGKSGVTNGKPAESDLGRRLREIKARIVASGEHLFESDEEVLEEVRQRRAGDITKSETHLRRLERPYRRRA